jgi:hypothetical protein
MAEDQAGQVTSGLEDGRVIAMVGAGFFAPNNLQNFFTPRGQKTSTLRARVPEKF